ncbi:exonuclease SbcCD subunit D [Geomonas nitrogeniifigens]|uniref:Exonuclease SbcCD subunit D n=1 Tax=Geomonas diazotrophica TaxID=2843197 RepID=A0ABX8JMA1_9BACT|nr:exonuclease SbcCD subunit D [Geomonas nitrogeniifigens]QWV99505.1 exonuclease SbcCD subunit D [Geomonas nitrogeniifigens]QXE88680.1 exonuclease SbcCD subunit D [Geomonas nitrogeniifigens]
MPVRFIHTSDIHLGKTYRGSGCDAQRYQDFFATFAAIVADAVREQVDFVLIGGDLFHTGQILPKTFAKTIEILQPLKDAGIPCLAVEGNHDWIHRRDSVSWMEALSQLGYISLLRPSRSADGGYLFEPFDPEQGNGGHIEVKGVNIYGLGYIGSQAGNHVPRICDAIGTKRNILLFHVGVWTYSPVEIGNIKPEEAQPLAACFDYVALGHGHKPYIVNDAEGRPYAFNPGSPDCVNFGEERYDKGYYLVALEPDGTARHEFRRTTPRPMLVVTANLDGAGNATDALERFRNQMAEKLAGCRDERAPLVEVRLAGKVGFHPFELSRDRLRASLCEVCEPLHLEIKNHLSLVSGGGGEEKVKKSLAEIERDVLGELIGANSHYQGRVEELTRLSLALRDLVLKGDAEGEELLSLLSSGGDQCA